MLFIQSMAMGFAIAAPVGPIGLLCIQRTLREGFRAGLATGMGAACADALYGLLGALGITELASTAPALAVLLKIGGGAFLVWLAWTILRESRSTPAVPPGDAHMTIARDFVTTFGLTLCNPMTILSFIGIFAALRPLSAVQRAQEGIGYVAVCSMVAGILTGSLTWWLCLCGMTATVRDRIPASLMRGIAGVSGLLIAIFGMIQVIAGLRGFIPE